jgi:uncharacterized membrane protein YhiD involved in acid resistance
MTFQDIFKSNFLENVAEVSILDTTLSMALSFGLGAFIFFTYRKTFKGVMYSSGFGVTLIALTMISTLVILAVTSNVVLSLGMVGALSIVRFRTAIKEPLDIAFLFWSIGAGIVLAAGMIPLAVFGSLAIGLILIVFVNKKTYDNPYIVVIRCNGEESENRARDLLKKTVQKQIVKSKTVTAQSTELHYEVRLINDDTAFVGSLSEIPGVSSVVLVSYNGDYMG